MINNRSLLALTIYSLFFTSNISAATKVADARGNAMGNTGVATADYLTAPFYNPALTSSYKEEDDFGIFVAVGLGVNDTDETYNTIDDFSAFVDEVDDVSGTGTAQDIETVKDYLDELDGNQLSVNLGVGVAIALPTKALSTNVFVRSYGEVFATIDTVESTTVSDWNEASDAFDNSTVELLSFGYAEVGLALAKEFKIAGERISFGISPKYQYMTTYGKYAYIDDYDLDDFSDSSISKSAINVDLGATWFKGNFRAGIAAKNLIPQEIGIEYTDANNYSASDVYNLDTQVTIALAYSSDYFTAAVDADLTKQTRFKNMDDDTQFVRFGLEGNAWGWAQLRAGYEIDLQDTYDNTITAGIGLSPFDLINVDIAASYTSPTEAGLSTTFALTF